MYFRERETKPAIAAEWTRTHKKLAADRLKAVAAKKKAKKA